MKLPCEIIITDVLPVIRKELAVRLVEVHGLTKTNVARLFNVSGTAISQYTHGMRGNGPMIADFPQYDTFINEIYDSAAHIASQKGAVMDELCRLCDIAKRIGIAEHIHKKGRHPMPLIKCAECPRSGIC